MAKAKQKELKTKKVSTMTAASFFFAAVVMMFVGVIGFSNIGKSYAAGAADLPQTITVHTDDTWGGESPKGTGVQYIEGLPLMSDFYGTDAAGKRYELYCLEHNKGMPASGTYTKDGNLTTTFTDKGITYIVSNSYPNNNSFMAGKKSSEKKYVTQYAIWLYQDRVKGVADNVDGEITAEMKAKIVANKDYGSIMINLAQKAIAANSATTPADSLAVNKTDISYNVTEDGKYFESNYIPVVGSNNLFKSYSVTLNNDTYGTKLVDEQGAEHASGKVFNAGSKFKVRVPLEKLKDLNNIKLALKISGTFKHEQVFAYRHSQANAQTALVAAFDYTNQNVDLNLDLNIPTGKVQISKQDITNSKEVAGATLVITDCNGKEVAKWVSTTEPFYIEALPVTTANCKYKLTETIAPNDYELNTESVEFEVKADGSITKVAMKDTPLTKTPDTGLGIPMIVYISGGLILLCGVAIIYASVKPKKED